MREAVKVAFLYAYESYIYPMLDDYIAALLPEKAIRVTAEAVLSASLSAAY